MFTAPTIKSVKAFTEKERELVARAASQVWQEIGCDYLQAVGEGRRNPEGVTVPRSHVIEAVCDADRLTQEVLRMHRRPAVTEEDVRAREEEKAFRTQLVARLNDTNYATLKRLVLPAFPFARYGY